LTHGLGSAALPPVRLHDLRHGAASLAHEAGADLKTLQDLLGHSSIVVTADTYTSVLPLAQRKCADATAKLVLAAARHTRQKIREKARRHRPDPHPATGAPTPTGPTADPKPQVNDKKRGRRHGGKSRSVTTTVRQPRDNHYPQQTHHEGRHPAVAAGDAPDDVARPKGFEPLTF
jgi:hypothetical protein